MLLQSTITCPHCGLPKTETMPTDACQFFYECTGCGTKLKPKTGDCCVFCSYGTVPCPPIQPQRAGEPSAAGCCSYSATSGNGLRRITASGGANVTGSK
ncbi:hypothetical protein V1289_007154 [Bradyrhizobium sp. AZCC 2289]